MKAIAPSKKHLFNTFSPSLSYEHYCSLSYTTTTKKGSAKITYEQVF